MGDTGSLAIGGLIGMVAICCRQELALIIVGGVFVMEAGSVMLQVGSFKLRKKRIFRMAPIHHHFELGGWKETQVITRFWILLDLLRTPRSRHTQITLARTPFIYETQRPKKSSSSARALAASPPPASPSPKRPKLPSWTPAPTTNS